MELVFATNNQNKVSEIQSLLKSSFELKSLADIGFTEEIPEDYETLKENALQKAKTIADKFSINCFADDTGLEVDALNGAPGVYSARYSGSADHSKNVDKLLLELKGESNRNARFRTVIALCLEGGEYYFEGVIEGRIATEKSGKKGFGYDPVFIPEGQKITFAEMTMAEKNEQSHRARAFAKFLDFLNNKRD